MPSVYLLPDSPCPPASGLAFLPQSRQREQQQQQQHQRMSWFNFARERKKLSVSCWDYFGGNLQGWNKRKWVYGETDGRYYGLCIVSLCASRPFCLPSFGGPQGVFREIVAMGYRHSMSVCHSPIGSGCHRLGHVLDLWWYGYGSLMMLLLSPSLLSVCACFLSLSGFLFVHSQTVGERGRQAALKRSRRVISVPGDGSALSEDVQTRERRILSNNLRRQEVDQRVQQVC